MSKEYELGELNGESLNTVLTETDSMLNSANLNAETFPVKYMGKSTQEQQIEKMQAVLTMLGHNNWVGPKISQELSYTTNPVLEFTGIENFACIIRKSDLRTVFTFKTQDEDLALDKPASNSIAITKENGVVSRIEFVSIDYSDKTPISNAETLVIERR